MVTNKKNSVRTLEVNRVVSLILNAGNSSGGSKKRKAHRFWRAFLWSGVGGVYLDSAKASLDINFSPKS